MGFLPWSDDSCRTYRYWRGNVLYFLGEQWTKPAGCGGCIEDFTAVPIYPGCILSQYKDRLSTSHCFRQIVPFASNMPGLQMMAINNQHVCYTLFSEPFRTSIHTKECIKQPRFIRNNQMFVATLYIHLIWNKPETNATKWKHMSSFVSLNPFRLRWHRCTWTFHWLRFGLCWWTTEFGFSTLGLQGIVVNEGANPGFNNQNAGFNNQSSSTTKKINNQQIQLFGCRIRPWW